MNSVFWLLVAALVLLALLIIVIPLLWKTQAYDDDVEQHNIKIARQRLADLQQQLKEGVLSQADYDAHLQELELTLSQDLEAGQQRTTPLMQGKWVALLVVWIIPVLSLVCYFLLGEPQAMAKMELAQQAQKQQDEAQNTIDQMVAGLATRLQQNPDDAEGWLMLGRSYKYLQQYAKASAAYEKAYHLLGDQADVILGYADAMASVDGSLKGKPAELVFKALAMEPNNTTGLWLAGMAKIEQGELQPALDYWLKLEKLLQDNPTELANLQQMIAAVRSKLQGQSPAPPQVETSFTQTSIAVEVKLAKELQQHVDPSSTVFVYAQALAGPKMPLAIVRKAASELPFSVVLDDSMAMMPGRDLSTTKQLKVIARVSKTGQAMQQSGDLIGFTELQQVNSTNAIAITINQRVP